jgi:predicted RNA methylase
LKKYSDIRRDLNVSDATINNWIKTGVIPAYVDEDGYDDEMYIDLINDIHSRQNRLQKRANRQSNHSGSGYSGILMSIKNRLIIDKLKEIMSDSKCSPDHLIFVVAVIILERKYLVNCRTGSKNIYISSQNPVFTAFLNSWMHEFGSGSLSLYHRLIIFDYPDNETDFLGALYDSLRTVADKSINGAYFTPALLTSGISLPLNSSVIDPCAGTGTMLLNVLSKQHNPSLIYLRDIDVIALRIAKVNFALFFNSTEKLVKTQVVDILKPCKKIEKKFDFIITNPPYGAKFSIERKKELIRDFPELSGSESFSIALLQSLNMLKKTGKLYFILPESILYVGTHLNIRKKIFAKQNSVKIIYYGQAFKGVMSPIVRVEIEKKGSLRIVARNGNQIEYSAKQAEKNQFRPPYVSSDEEIDKLEKILSVPSFRLEGKCKFGLGIVTGNNRKHLSIDIDSKIHKAELIYTGKELHKFFFSEPKFCIDYNPRILQQTAPLKQYRSPKICYRFISDSLVTCFDETGKLILNSINFFTIQTPDIPPKALCAYLNSSIASFLYRKMFNSTKVLRSHIEMIPIPNSFYENIDKLESLYEQASKGFDISEELNLVCEQMFFAVK